VQKDNQTMTELTPTKLKLHKKTMAISTSAHNQERKKAAKPG